MIILTAFGTVEAASGTMQKGAFDFITKPFHKEQILFTIDRALKYSKLQQENRKLREELERRNNP